MTKIELLRENKDKIIHLYSFENTSAKEISRLFKVDHSQIRQILKENNIKTRSISESAKYHRTYQFNENFFEVIDTENKAYWLGFILADGHVSELSITIGLDQKDKHHLLKLVDALEYNKVPKITESKTINILTISSHKMSTSLRKLGLLKNKTFSLPQINISSDLYFHFLRGYFDGDGCITSIGRTHKNLSFGLTSGDLNFLKCISDQLIEQLNIRSGKFRKYKNKEAFDVRYFKKEEVEKILYSIYDNATVYLERKYSRYLNYLNGKLST